MCMWGRGSGDLCREWTKLRAAGMSRRQLGGFEVRRGEGLCKGPKVGGS